MNVQSQEQNILRFERRIGQILVEKGKLDADAMDDVLAFQKQQATRFGEAAIKMNLISEMDLTEALHYQSTHQAHTVLDTQFSPELVCIHKSQSDAARSIYDIRTQINLTWPDDLQKVFTVCSYQEKQGADLIAANLAIAYAQSGQKTLLIDLQANPKSTGQWFGLSNQISAQRYNVLHIADLPHFGFTRQRNMEVVIYPIRQHGAEDYSMQVKEFVQRERDNYDVVIVNSPAIAGNNVAEIAVAVTGNAVLVVKPGKGKLRQLMQFKQRAENIGAAVRGCIFSKIKQ
jgi:Mrp family chromosome partitioning ATPase